MITNTLLCFNITMAMAAWFPNSEKEKKPQMYEGDIHHIACVKRWRLAAKCAVGAWLKCPLDPDRVKVEEKGYTTFQVEGGEIHLKRHNLRRTWDGALEMCRSDGATLVKIDTEKKQDIVRGLFNFKDYENQIGLWIGLRDTTRSNVFRWTDASVPAYTNWGKGQPSFTCGFWDEDFVNIFLRMHGSVWNDRDCSALLQFVCEM